MTTSQGTTYLHQADPHEFVRLAAEVTNTADHARAAELYATGATVTVLIDGAREVYRGRDEIRRAWDSIFGALADRSVTVEKSLVSASDSSLVNTWAGTDGSEGLEVWFFDEAGRVTESRLLGSLSVHPSTHLVAQLRVAVGAPRAALATLRHQRRVGLWPRRRRSVSASEG